MNANAKQKQMQSKCKAKTKQMQSKCKAKAKQMQSTNECFAATIKRGTPLQSGNAFKNGSLLKSLILTIALLFCQKQLKVALFIAFGNKIEDFN